MSKSQRDDENSGTSEASTPSSDAAIEPVDVLRQFTDVMANFLETSHHRPSNASIGSEALPDFDPSKPDFSSEKWCKKVDECKAVFHWTEESTIFFAIRKFKGMANLWYKSLPTMMLTWQEWKTKLQAAFPSQTDYHALLQRMMARVKKPEENYTTYYYCKLSLLNELEITAFGVSTGGIGDMKLGKLDSQPFNTWKHAKETSRKHENNNYHKKSILGIEYLRDIELGKSKSIDLQIDLQTGKTRSTILLCGRQGIVIRGHRDDKTLFQDEPNTKNDKKGKMNEEILECSEENFTSEVKMWRQRIHDQNIKNALDALSLINSETCECEKFKYSPESFSSIACNDNTER
ncbi:unnamed protein product [Brassicogethes aeneus]|uniref:Retrotransposon gag domain-containing protein n=1 Tax=Brassicogethes aeneus TaxID=1431903 RepID=A0A9P0AS73_BRAAE|nr:unnamed protein product [Brassicogethes aeneus]